MIDRGYVYIGLFGDFFNGCEEYSGGWRFFRWLLGERNFNCMEFGMTWSNEYLKLR